MADIDLFNCNIGSIICDESCIKVCYRLSFKLKGFSLINARDFCGRVAQKMAHGTVLHDSAP